MRARLFTVQFFPSWGRLQNWPATAGAGDKSIQGERKGKSFKGEPNREIMGKNVKKS